MNFQNTAHVLLFNAHCAASMKCLHSYIEENLEKPVKGGTGWTIWASNGWEIFLIWKTPRLALGTTQPPNQQIPTFLLIFESAQHVSGKHLPETCWADSKINKIVIFASSWSFILLTYIEDARSNTNQIYRISRPIRRTFFSEKCDLNSTCVLCAEGKYYFQTYKHPYIYYTTSLSWDSKKNRED